MQGEIPAASFTETIKNVDRPRGILSKRDRRFLLEESYREKLADQSRRNVRSRLRERLRHSILDFYLLDEYLEDRDREPVFSEIDDPLREGLHAIMAFLYKASDRDEETIAAWYEGGLKHIEVESGSKMIVDEPSVEITITPGQAVDPEAAEAKIEAGNIEDLSPAELRFMLWQAGRIFGSQDADDPYSQVLGEYVDRFEEKTNLAEARKMLENQSNEQ